MFIQSSDLKNAGNSTGTAISKVLSYSKNYGGRTWELIKSLPYNFYSDLHFKYLGKHTINIKEIEMELKPKYSRKSTVRYSTTDFKQFLKLNRHDPDLFLKKEVTDPMVST